VTLQELILAVGAVSALIPAGAVFVRGRSRARLALTGAVAIMAVLFFLLVLAITRAAVPSSLLVLVTMATGVPLVLCGLLASVGFGQEDPVPALVESRRTVFLVGLVGLGIVLFLGSPEFVRQVSSADRETIHIGFVGKGYVSYLLIGVVLIGYNLERTYRVADPRGRQLLKAPVLALFVLLGYVTFVLTSAMLYSSIGVGKLVGAALPVVVASTVVGYGYLRGSLTDVAAPVSRTIVYSSFTAVAAGLFVAAVGIAGQLAVWTHSSPDEILGIAFGILLALVVGLMIFSNRFHRQVRRFIDRNFYVNRYDYRSQWSDVLDTFDSLTDREQVLDRAVAYLTEVFRANGVTVALDEEREGTLSVARGQGSGAGLRLTPGSPLHARLGRERRALLFERKPHDFTYIPVYAENGDWLDETASQLIVPLFHDQRLVGTVGLRRDPGSDPYTFEDAALLDSVAAHIGATIRTADLSREVSEAREMELLSGWATMLLHDLKNYLSPLSLAARNLANRGHEPAVVEGCANDIQHVITRMRRLVGTLSELRENPGARMVSLDPVALIEDAISETGVRRCRRIELITELDDLDGIRGDRDMLMRILVNLITNALEAMPDEGTLRITATRADVASGDAVVIRVADTGQGMSGVFLRERLFRPFSTTKRGGLGLGLYHSRIMAQLHGGELTASSTLGTGSEFRLTLPIAPAADTRTVSGPEREMIDAHALRG